MHLDLPEGFVARAYRGQVDHALLAAIKTASQRDDPDAELSTAEQFDASYPHLERCRLDRDVAIVETAAGGPVAYLRTSWDLAEGDSRVWHSIVAVDPEHRSPELLAALVAGWEAHVDLIEPDESEFDSFLADPLRDESLWKIAWAGDGPDALVVGQVKSYINVAENEAAGRLRGYTEHISTTLGWRGRGIARALIVASLHELRARGMTEAALGADTDNPQAFDLYRMLGYEVIAYQAQYDKPRGRASHAS